MEKKKNGIIYKSTNLINNKIYIGYTTQTFKTRIRRHNYGKSYFNKALKKYGKDNFKWEIIESEIPYELLGERETYHIKQFQSNISKYGYNLTKGGDGNLSGNRRKRYIPTTLDEYLDFIELIEINKPEIIDEYKPIIESKINMLCLV